MAEQHEDKRAISCERFHVNQEEWDALNIVAEAARKCLAGPATCDVTHIAALDQALDELRDARLGTKGGDHG